MRLWAGATTEQIAEVVGDPSAATAEAGAAIVAHWTAQLAEALGGIARFAFPARTGGRPQA